VHSDDCRPSVSSLGARQVETGLDQAARAGGRMAEALRSIPAPVDDEWSRNQRRRATV
jgi:hypothetical protein